MSQYSSYDEYEFRSKINACLDKIKLILDSSKSSSVVPANELDHRYEDKYLLANYLTKTALSSILVTLSHLGLTSEALKQLIEWSKQNDVSLRFESVEQCEFVKETKREVEDPVKFETKKSGIGFSNTTTSKSFTTITEYVYSFSVEYRISAFRGVGEHDNDGLTLLHRNNLKHFITQRSKDIPYSALTKVSHDVNISFLIRNLDEQTHIPRFEIKRSSKECYTPRQNKDVDDLISNVIRFGTWCDQTKRYFFSNLFPVEMRHRNPTGDQPLPDLSAINAAGIFLPVVPLFQDTPSDVPILENATVDDSTSVASTQTQLQSQSHGSSWRVNQGGPTEVVLSSPIQTRLLAEQMRSLEEKIQDVCKLFPDASSQYLISGAEVTIVIAAVHMADILSQLIHSLDFIEDMLRKQLVAAVGKQVQPSDFAEYMKFHCRKLFKPEFQPKPFSHSIRRSASHSPEGTIRIEETGSIAEPLSTVSCTAPAERSLPMQFTLNASTKVTFGGERTLHACLLHKFSDQATATLQLVTEARQFSCYIVLIGRIASATLFEPKFGIIVQNKDEIKIPLDLEQIPTPKEFKDAIKSLSPEQQRFAQAYRSMQLESTLFGVCVIQIKPQLEKLLKLTPDSLTKEIRLTQDLMELFIKYQIPSDLLSFDGSESADSAARLQAVKGHVQAIQNMIEDSKKKEVEAQKQQREYEGKKPQGAASLELEREVSYQSNSRTFSMTPKMSAPMSRRRFLLAAPTVTEAFGDFDMDSGVADEEFIEMDMPTSSECAPVLSDEVRSQPRDEKAKADPPGKKRITAAEAGSTSGSTVLDYTQYPKLLDKAYELFDVDSSLRPTIINPSEAWTKRTQKTLLDAPTTVHLRGDSLATEKTAAFDLLDALSRSGALTVDDASLHVVIAATHCFDKSLMDTIVQRNVNPIERAERSVLIMASTVHGAPSCELITEAQRARVATYSPMLFLENENAGATAGSMET